MNEERVNIILLSYYSWDILKLVVDQIRRVTDYKNYQIIVADNFSIKSKEMRENIKEYVELGIISKAYLFDKNYMINAWKYVLFDNIDSKYTILSDYDAFIMKPLENSCWLTDFITLLETEKNVSVAQFSSKNQPLIDSNSNSEKLNKDKWTMNGKSNGHYMTAKTSFFVEYVNTGDGKNLLVDGNIMLYAERVSYRMRYDKNSVINLSSELCGTSNLVETIAFDPDYLELRTMTLRGGRSKDSGIGFHDYVEISSNSVEII